MNTRRRLLPRTLVALVLALDLMLMGTAAHAHGDEDHSKDAPKPAGNGAAQAGLAGAGGATSPQRLPDGSVNLPKVCSGCTPCARCWWKNKHCRAASS